MRQTYWRPARLIAPELLALTLDAPSTSAAAADSHSAADADAHTDHYTDLCRIYMLGHGRRRMRSMTLSVSEAQHGYI